MAMLPATARAILVARLGLNDLCVKCRWKPTVTPWPEIQYIAKAMITSCQPSQPPQATGTARTSARNGTAMKIASAARWVRLCTSLPRVGSGVRSGVTVGAVILAKTSLSKRFPAVRTGRTHTYATVTYAPVGDQRSSGVVHLPAIWGSRFRTLSPAIPGWSVGRARRTLNADKRRRFDSYPGSDGPVPSSILNESTNETVRRS